MQLRQADATGLKRAAYRMTARQLESMIRLSEAVARLHFSGEITVKHVREACRLLDRSIINIETEPVDLDDDEEDEVAAAATASSAADIDMDETAIEDDMPALKKVRAIFLLYS